MIETVLASRPEWFAAYEYDDVGLPFLAKLDRVFLEYERRREPPRRPDLSRLAVHD